MPLTRLPEDVLRLVAGLLEQVSPGSLGSLSLACKQLHTVVRAAQARAIVIEPGTKEGVLWLRELAKKENNDLLPAVRSMRIQQAQGSDWTQATQDISDMCTLLKHMTGLRDISLHGELPHGMLLGALKDKPTVRLHLKLHIDAEPTESTSTQSINISDFVASINLRSIDVCIAYFNARRCAAIMSELKDVLLSCQKLENLSLAFDPQSGIVAMFGCTPESCGIGLPRSQCLPPLKALTLLKYPFQRQLQADGTQIPAHADEIQSWREQLNWSQLEELNTDDNDFAFGLLPKLTALRRMTTSNEWRDQDVSGFYLQVPSRLTSITVPSLKCITLDGILRHSNTLETLHVHQAESFFFHWKEYVMDPASLREIQRRCKLLSELSLDIGREGAWPEDMFQILGEFERIHTLHLWFELGVNSPQQPVQPFVTTAAVGHIFESIRRSQKSQLSRLAVHSGAPPQLPTGFLAEEALWAEKNSITFECTLSERDDEVKTGVYRVACPELEKVKQRSRKVDHLAARSQNGHGSSQSHGLKWVFRRLAAVAGRRVSRSGGDASHENIFQDDPAYQRISRLMHEGPKSA